MKSPKKAPEYNKSFYDNTFVKGLDLTALEKAAVIKLSENYIEVASMMFTMVGGRYKLGYGYSDKLKSFCATFTPTVEGDINTGLVLSGMGSTPQVALASALYKHHFKCENGRWPREENNGGIDVR